MTCYVSTVFERWDPRMLALTEQFVQWRGKNAIDIKLVHLDKHTLNLYHNHEIGDMLIIERDLYLLA